MKKSFNYYLALTLVILGPSLPTASMAQDEEFNVEDIRRELAAAANAARETEAAPAEADSFVLGTKDIDEAASNLQAEEESLLKKLKDQQTEANSATTAQALDTSDLSEASKRALGLSIEDSLVNEAVPQVAASDASSPAQELAPPSFEGEIEVVRAPESDRASADVARLPLEVEPKLEVPSSRSAALIEADKSASHELKKVSAQKTEAEKELKNLKSKQSGLEVQVKSQSKEIASVRKTNTNLQTQLRTYESRISAMSKELEESRNRLMIAETEVERLSGVLEARNRTSLATLGGEPQKVSLPVSAPAARTAPVAQAKPAPDMPVATVVVEKANLRTAPGENNSPLMSVSRGTRLAVETRKGAWYRIISPTGTRAWISADVVAFGPTSQSSPSRTIRVKGYDSTLEANSPDAR